MAASYPGSVKTFTSKSAAQTIEASHVNDLQDEVNAIEAGLLNGTAPLNSSNSTVANLVVTGGSTLGTLNVTGGSTITTLTVNTISAIGGLGSTFTTIKLTSSTPATPVANTLYKNTLVAAWGQIDGNQAFSYGVNVASVSSNGSTAADVTFTTALASSQYVVTANAYASSVFFFIRQKSTAGFTLCISHGSWPLMNFMVVGG